MTRRDWWLGIAAVVIAIVLHALLPRYEWRQIGRDLIRIDRWTGGAELGQWARGQWAPRFEAVSSTGTAPTLPVATPTKPTIEFRVEDIDPEPIRK